MYNKTALITGAAKRIGAGVAKHLHNQGMNVIVHYNTSAKEAHELVRSLNKIRHDSAITAQADLAHKEYYAALIDAANDFKDGIDTLINNASVFFPTPTHLIDEQQWNQLININLKAPLFLSKLAAPSLKKKKGCIINISDIHANRPLLQHPIYSISKAGMQMLTQSLSKELAPHVRVNAIAPGAIVWPEETDETEKQTIITQTMLGRAGEIDDISSAVTYLIRDADYVTGQILTVDGGRTLFS